MAKTTIISGIDFPVATDAAWSLLNPVLRNGEQIYVKLTEDATELKIKVGDGATAYDDLPFAVDMVEARQLLVDTTAQAAVAETQADRAESEADRSEAAVDNVYTHQEAVKKFAFLEAALGNSVQITDAIGQSSEDDTPVPLATLEIRGETQGRILIFGTDNIVTTGDDWPYSVSDSITISGTTSHDGTYTVTGVSGKILSFASSTFTAGVETDGSITNGTTVYQITVDPDHPQTLTSQTSFDYQLSGKNIIRQNQTFPQTSNGVTCTYNADTDEYTLNGTATGTVALKLLSVAAPYVFKLPANKYLTLGIFRVSGTNSATVNLYCDKGTQAGAWKVSQIAALGTSDSSKISNATRVDELFLTAIQFTAVSGTVFSNLVVKVSAEINSVSTSSITHEIPKPSVTTLPTTSILLQDTSATQLYNRGIPLTYNTDGSVATWAAQDKVVKVDGVWGLKEDGDNITLNGTESCDLYLVSSGTDVNTIAFIITLPAASLNIGNAILSASNLFKSVTADNLYITDHECITVRSLSIRVRILRSRLSTEDVAGFKTWLSSNNLAVIYKTLTANYTELCAADQTSLTEAEQAGTFAGTTNIMLSTPIGEAYAEGAKNITTVIDNLTAAVAALS